MSKKKNNELSLISKKYGLELDELVAHHMFGWSSFKKSKNCLIGSPPSSKRRIKVPEFSNDRNLSYLIEMEIFNKELEVKYFDVLCRLLWCPSPHRGRNSHMHLELWYIRTAAPWAICEAALEALGLERNL